jgi:diguanylate cyclase (GGDEF)-like protein/PAS domain S-box-containing protein
VLVDGVPVAEDELDPCRMLTGAASASRTVRLGVPGGPLHDVVISSRRIDGPGGRLLGAVAAFTDVTAERAVQDRLRESAAFHDAVIAVSPDIIYVVDIETRHSVWTSPTLPETLDYSPQQLTELGPRIIDGRVHPEDRPNLDASYAAAADLADGAVLSLVVRVANGHGQFRWLSRLITPFARDDDGTVRQLLGVARDITEIVEVEQQLTEAALHDPLTGLPNRRLLSDRLESALRRATTDAAVVVLFCDLDGFKQVNDSGGHAAGDAVLTATAARLRNLLRPQDTVARVGGDEFVVVLDPLPMRVHGGATGDAPETRARSMVRRITSALGDPVEVAGIPYRVTVSIGVTYARPGDGVEDTLRDADSAMYRAKVLGKARHETLDRCRSPR